MELRHESKYVYVLVVALIIGLVAGLPLVTIWSINTLFSCGIAYTFKSWLAMAILLVLFLVFRNTNARTHHRDSYDDLWDDDEYWDDEDDDDDWDEDEDVEDRKARIRAKLIDYAKRKRQKERSDDDVPF